MEKDMLKEVESEIVKQVTNQGMQELARLPDVKFPRQNETQEQPEEEEPMALAAGTIKRLEKLATTNKSLAKKIKEIIK